MVAQCAPLLVHYRTRHARLPFIGGADGETGTFCADDLRGRSRGRTYERSFQWQRDRVRIDDNLPAPHCRTPIVRRPTSISAAADGWGRIRIRASKTG